MRMNASFVQLLHAFFENWLVQQRNVSVHTVLSYRDTWRLFLRFTSERQRCQIESLSMAQITASEVLAFLQHNEDERHVSIGTRNCRLAALKSFFRFVETQEPSALAQCAQVLAIPSKRMQRRVICYLESDEVAAILAQPDRSTIEGQRDHALLSFLYNTGARIQEALDLCPRDIRFEAPFQVRLLGKGRKERTCPLWPQTVTLLQALLRRQPHAPDERLFVNRYGSPLSASGVRFKLRQYVQAACQQVPSLSSKRVTPHVWRHTTGVHLVASHVDVTVIRSWLGHASLDMTNQYAQANMQTMREALQQFDVPSAVGHRPRWKRSATLLDWLDSL
ncbi:integrase [Cupriavidus sp. TA19]|uniref:tyrosine-type recombinase/integrase n=1 Tax=unclassified Cupriavidus TaxID=2640874 RepID=UPI000E2F7F42|nr:MULTISPECIES: tyrosine-type recombinase/integrase [unclassified Cupriavidus]BDB29452.1 site-specific integrase [Cupriavidus sp. P-10]GLC97955.1 integrase [Cupriavidus sp. TA19]